MRLLAIAGLVFIGSALVLPAQAQDLDSGRPPTHAAATLASQNPLLLATPNVTTVKLDDSAPLGLLLPKYGRWVGITKWVTLAASVGFGALGFSLHNDGDNSFDRLVTLCEADPPNCRALNPDGSYQDPLLESLYQNVVDRDRQARFSLIAAEVNFGVSVLLFIVDFQKSGAPRDIPYDPDNEKAALRLTAKPGELALRYYFK
jgi:hypothetical protein